jgi:mitochondrial splicing suppressor protein 51
MENTYMCLRCIRVLGPGAGIASKTRPSQILSIARRSFASSAQRQSLDAKPPRSRNISQPKPEQHRRRAAHTATAQAEEPDNFERHNQLPNDYGDYRAHPRTILRPNNLFHPFSKSPIPEIRQRAAFTKQHAYCPHPIHQQTRVPISPNDPEARKTVGEMAQPAAHVQFECPDCGIATYCCEEHWADDYEAHLEICDTLQQINEDDHDLRSGRWFPEFEYPGPQLDEIMVNLTSWDTFLYTRGFEAINEDRSMRQATRLLTYPLTVGAVLHELSPYNIRSGGRLTIEGLKSLSGRWQRIQ